MVSMQNPRPPTWRNLIDLLDEMDVRLSGLLTGRRGMSQTVRRQLVDAGVLHRAFDRKTGLVTVTVTKAVAPPPAPEQPAIWPRPPSPKGVFRRALRGGAKITAHIKAKVEEKMLTNRPGMR